MAHELRTLLRKEMANRSGPRAYYIDVGLQNDPNQATRAQPWRFPPTRSMRNKWRR